MQQTSGPAPEWAGIEQAIAASYAGDPATWASFARCRAVAVYSAGSPAAADQPGGWAVILAGFADRRDRLRRAPPGPRARLEISGALPPPAAHATLAAVLAGLAVLQHLGRLGWRGQASQWATPPWPPAPDPAAAWAAAPALRQIYDALQASLGWVVAGGVPLEWTPDPAARLAPPTAPTLAAAAAGGAAARGPTPAEPAPPGPDPSPAAPGAPPAAALLTRGEADYLLILETVAEDTGSGQGRYSLWTRDGRQRIGAVPLAGLTHPDEGEYRTLIAALTALAEQITRARRPARRYRLQVLSARESVVRYLQARTAGPAAHRPPGARTAREILAHFGTVAVEARPAPEIAALLAGGAADPAFGYSAGPIRDTI
ncbi:MAG TPA: hypothetical protein VKY74_06480 [Chloroflexia bacterium]|nr:hypothetical protein [Chloroflexia bacterium]